MVSIGLLSKTVSWFEPLQIKEFRVHQNKLIRYLHISHITIISDEEVSMKFTLKGIDVAMLTETRRPTIDLLKVRQEYVRLAAPFIIDAVYSRLVERSNDRVRKCVITITNQLHNLIIFIIQYINQLGGGLI